MTRPKIFGGNGQGFQQSRGERLNGEVLHEPVFQAIHKILIGHPMRGQSEATLRVIRGTQPMKFPQFSGQSDVSKSIAFPPPDIPERPPISVVSGIDLGQFTRQQPSRTEQTSEENL